MSVFESIIKPLWTDPFLSIFPRFLFVFNACHSQPNRRQLYSHTLSFLLPFFSAAVVVLHPHNIHIRLTARNLLPKAAMSPHAVQPTPGSPRLGLDFNKFAVTRNAFLPEKSPVHVLSDPYYQPWEAVGQNLARLIDDGTIHDAIRQLPILSVDKLVSEAEWRRAYTMLAFMTHAYVWGGDKPEEVCLRCFRCDRRHQEAGKSC